MASNSLVKLTLESSQYERGLRNAQKQLSEFTRAIGINMKSLSGMALAAGAVTGALKVAKDAFFKNEQQLDEWGRTVEASKSLYSGFLNALNTGDISGYLSNINKITEAARAAYDALDALGTFSAFNQINVEKTRTAMTESIVDYREGNGSKEAVKAAGEAYKKELAERKRLEKDAYLESVRKIAAERGVEYKDLLDALSGSYGHYQDLKKIMPTGSRIVGYSGGMFGGGGTYKETFAQNKAEKLGEALRQLNDTELRDLQALGAQAERTGNQIAQVDRQLVRVLYGINGKAGSGGGGTSGGGAKAINPFAASDFGGLGINLTESMSDLRGRMREYQQMMADATTQTMYEAARKGIEETQRLMDAQPLALRMGISAEDAAKLQEQVNSIKDIVQESLKNEPVTLYGTGENETAQATAKDNKEFSRQLIGNISTITGALEQLGVDVPEGFTKTLGVMQIITTILTALQSLQTITATTSILKSIPIIGMFLHNGGVVHAANGFSGTVPGTQLSGDNIPAMLNAGELVLNRSQVAGVASALTAHESSSYGGGEVRVEADEMVLLIRNGAKRKGMTMGEYLGL